MQDAQVGFNFKLEWEKIMTNTLVIIKLHIFSHHTFYLSLKPLSDGVVYLGTVIQVDEIRKEVEIKELGPFILCYRHFSGFSSLRFPTNQF